MKPKTLLRDFERATSMFQVQPDWYEDYWLKPEKASRPAATRLRRSMSRFHVHLLAAAVSGLAAFIRSRTGGAV
ncbi:hypothetical protein L6654_30965 [Bradyrhizobium sp. WYCCWR 13023]|uniref:Uncharacterized protein n=1 Tax=Bradyrhizobium zhengyangense TaxID=2911009 RepID=A0A9X1RIX2_9BRAD|nr:hypothetical protein [Bradyrhizobium zhengyangense]MCG2631060.1 hypothetical protein [Bradyrhizobium zhengyangense]